MSTFQFEKDKYLQIVKTKGIQAALTTLHLDMDEWELETFEGQKGYQPQSWDNLSDVRTFSRDLWTLALEA